MGTGGGSGEGVGIGTPVPLEFDTSPRHNPPATRSIATIFKYIEFEKMPRMCSSYPLPMIRPMNRWLIRFAMSFFVIAAVLLWEAYQASLHDAPQWRIVADVVGAMAAISLGITGTHQKHYNDKQE